VLSESTPDFSHRLHSAAVLKVFPCLLFFPGFSSRSVLIRFSRFVCLLCGCGCGSPLAIYKRMNCYCSRKKFLMRLSHVFRCPGHRRPISCLVQLANGAKCLEGASGFCSQWDKCCRHFLRPLPLLIRPKVLSNPFETCLSLGDPEPSDPLSLFNLVCGGGAWETYMPK